MAKKPATAAAYLFSESEHVLQLVVDVNVGPLHF